MQAASNLEHMDQDPYKYVGDSIPLLSKYDIPITHLDFPYVEKCQDGKELERILHVLKSGEEGYYPELMQAVENKLKMINPKSKFLRNMSRVLSKEEVENEEWEEITKDLNDWVVDITKDNRELELRKRQKTPTQHEPRNIRQTKQITDITEEKKIKPQKIKSTDYAAWDKYDADAELLEIALNEEKIQEEAKHKTPSIKTKKKVKFNIFASDVEAKSEAKVEREKGNEYFKAGDYNSALSHYSASLECISTVEAFNNRAVTNLKLGQYEDAIKDCDGALGLEPLNLKAHWRKAMALDGLGEFNKALECVEMCVDVNPNNEEIQNLANSIRRKCNKTNGVKRRIHVKDVAHVEEEKGISRVTKNERKEIVAIPGTSRMPEPYFIECCPEDTRRITNILYLKRSEQEMPPRLLNCADRSIMSHIRSNDRCLDHNSNEDVIHVLHDPSNLSVETEKQGDAFTKRKSKKNQRSVKNMLENKNLDDRNAGGEPHRSDDTMILPEDIYSPYEFLKTWNNIRDDVSLKKQAYIIRNMDMEQIVEVIGCKLDNNMFSVIIRTLSAHFTVPGDVEKVYSVLLNFARLPRFQIISMLMSEQDRNCVKMLISFLQQHDKELPENVINILTT